MDAPGPVVNRPLRYIAWILTFYKKMLNELAARQNDYFTNLNPKQLAPLSWPQLAEPLGVSRSTVQRAAHSIGHIVCWGRKVPLDSLAPHEHLQIFRAFYVLKKRMIWGDPSPKTARDFTRIFRGIAVRTARKYLHEFNNRENPVRDWVVVL